MLFYFADLENFKTQPRNAVNVREGQGVVLLCGTPMHSGGKQTRKKCENFDCYMVII